MGLATQKTALKRIQLLLIVLCFTIFAVGCASSKKNVEDPLSEADLFDGLVEGSDANYATDLDLPAEGTSATNNNETIIDDNPDGYEFYYEALAGQSLSTLAYALYNDAGALDRIYKYNPSLAGKEKTEARIRIYFDLASSAPRSEFLTKGMIDRYAAALAEKIAERRKNLGGNTNLMTTQVGEGETLQIISERLYGTTRLWTELYVLNHDKVKNYDKLAVGTELQYYPVADFTRKSVLANVDFVEGKNNTPPKDFDQAYVDEPEQSNKFTQKPSQKVITPEPIAQPKPVATNQDLETYNEPEVISTPKQIVDETPTVAATTQPAKNTEAEKPVVEPQNIVADTEVEKPATSISPVTNPVLTQKQIRPNIDQIKAEADAESGFFTKNMRRLIYVALIGLILVGGYFLTRPKTKFNSHGSKFGGIQPMPSKPMQSPSQNRLSSSPGGGGNTSTGPPKSGAG